MCLNLGPRRRKTRLAGWILALMTLMLPANADPLEALVAEFSGALAQNGGVCSSPQSLGIWPFDHTHIPIGETAARRLYNDLLALVVASDPDCMDVMDGTGIGAILEHLHRTGALREAGGNPIAALAEANRDVDIVALADLTAQGGTVFLSLKGVDRADGRTLAQTKAYALPPERVDSSLTDTAQDLEDALARAVTTLLEQVPDMTRLVPAGVYFHDTGAQPEFGRYVEERVVNGLVQNLVNVITDRALEVLEPEFDLTPNLGQVLSPRELDPLARIAARDGTEGLYQLRGTYWVLGEVVDLTLSLHAAEGRAATWQGRLRAAQLGDIALQPQNLRLTDDRQEMRSFAVLMTSPRGEDPIYHPGEEFLVYFRSDRRVWLYCFYIDAVGDVVQVLPNVFRKDFAQGHMLSPYVLHALPDPRRDPFTFRINADTLGEERLKCMATTRDVTDDLPPVLRGQSFAPIPLQTAARIDALFEALPDTALAEASVTVTVAPHR